MPLNRSSKLLGLEAIRFGSAFAVLIWHYQHFAFVAYRLTQFEAARQPFYPAFKWLYDYGFYGVQVFWCISGFIFFWKYSAPIATKLVDAKEFFVLRFSRLYPLHITTLLLVALLQLVYFHYNHFYFVNPSNDSKHFFLQLFLASSWGFERGYSFNSPIWSISVEVLVYVFFFGTARFLGTSPALNIVVLLLCVILRKMHVDSPVVECIAFFYSGGLSALALQHFSKTKYHTGLKILAACIAVLVPILVYTSGMLWPKYLIHFALLTYIPTLLYCLANDFPAGPKMQHVIAIAGSVTYSSYLIHFPLQIVIALAFGYFNKPIPFYNAYFFVAFITTTFSCALLVFRYVEMPAQAYIRNTWMPAHATPVSWGSPNWIRIR